MVKREIHAIDFAICEAITMLNTVFRGRLHGWEVSRKGFNAEVEERDGHVVTAIVRPLNWPKDSFISLILSDDTEGWQVQECYISVSNMNGFQNLALTWESSVFPFFVPLSVNTPEEKTFWKTVGLAKPKQS